MRELGLGDKPAQSRTNKAGCSLEDRAVSVQKK
jgi:hypothetical protein